ncbi:MAG TPA: protocatechuate 3,4-dioxygenase subunit alpha [Ktedonobacterales bacterium]
MTAASSPHGAATTTAAAGVSPSQTVGPFFLNCLLRDDAHRNVLVGPQTAGERIRIEGRVLDGNGAPVPDAMVEIWQANAAGRYRHPADQRDDLPLDPDFIGFGRSGTDDAGAFWFETVRPGAVPFESDRMQAPHIGLHVFARGLLNHLTTRLYFDGEPANASDPVLLRVPEARRATLFARRAPGAAVAEPAIYRLDIVLQGPGETVFFNV